MIPFERQVTHDSLVILPASAYWLFRETEHLPRYEPERFTCYGCAARELCEFAWDSYNTDGDCLAEK
jgi:hypothetical protein